MLERWIVRNWSALCVGCILTGVFIRLTYEQRGYFSIGGEWLIIPMAIAVRKIFRKIRRAARECR